MDARFYQFWGDFVRQATSGQIGSRDFAEWMRQGAEIPEELTAIFKKYYGLDQMAADAPDYSAVFENALKEFNDSLANLYSILDVVPRREYQDLENKYNELKRKVAELEEVIAHLKLLYKTSTPNTGEGVSALNQMLKTQNEQFLKMMDSLAEFYGISKDKEPDSE